MTRLEEEESEEGAARTSVTTELEATIKSKDLVSSFLDGIIERETRNAPPYR